MFVSYAQNFEDVILWRVLGDIESGTYLDIGANHPVNDSVSLAFYQRGWRGIHVEPVPELAAGLREQRPDEAVIEAAVGSGRGKVNLHNFVGTGMTTAIDEFAKQHSESGWQSTPIRVDQVSLDDVLAKVGTPDLHWMKIDVEGMEKPVLESWKVSEVRPWVVVIESVLPNSTVTTHHEWESFVKDKGYKFAYFDGLNRFYIHQDHIDLKKKFGPGPNFHDHFSISENSPFAETMRRKIAEMTQETEQRVQRLVADFGRLDDEKSGLVAETARLADEKSRVEGILQNQAGKMSEALTASVAAVQAEASDNRQRVDAVLESVRAELLSTRHAAEAAVSGAHRESDAKLKTLRQDLAALRRTHSADLKKAEKLLKIRADKVQEAKVENGRLQGALDTQASTFEKVFTSLRREASAARMAGIAELDKARSEFLDALAVVELSKEEYVRQCWDLQAALEAERAYSQNQDALRLSAEVMVRDREHTNALLDAERATKAQLEARFAEVSHALSALQHSTLWRLMAPVRAILGGTVGRRDKPEGSDRLRPSKLRQALRGLWAWVTLQPGSRPRRLGRGAISWLLLRRGTRPRRLVDGIVAWLTLKPGSRPVRLLTKYRATTASSRRDGAEPILVEPILSHSDDGVVYYYVDHTIGCPVNTGMQRVVRGLAAGLQSVGERLVYVKWSRDLKMFVLISRSELTHLCKWNGPDLNPEFYPDDDQSPEVISVSGDSTWIIIPEVTYINHMADNPTLELIMAAREKNLKTAAIFYDAIPLVRSEFQPIAKSHEYYMRALMLADYIAPISKWSAQDLVSYFQHNESATLDCGARVEPLLLPTKSSVMVAESTTGRNQKLILSVGTIESRKNQDVLLAAFESFLARHPKSGWRLELVGNLHENLAEAVLGACERTQSISHRRNLSDEELGALYNACAFTVFPSIEEGFGLPIVESLSQGKPCICADFGAMAEVAEGGGCYMVDTHSVDALSAAIERLALDPAYRYHLVSEAAGRNQTSWPDYADTLRRRLDYVGSPQSQVGRIYYWIDQTVQFGSNTGIQRVVRGLAKSIIEHDVEMMPVKWSMADQDFIAPTSQDLEHLGDWNGPDAGAWVDFDAFEGAQPGDWLFIPEVLSSPAGPQIAQIHHQARARGLRVAWIFYDAIPWKLRDFYPIQATDAHGAYMLAMADADLIFGISDHSTGDLIDFLRASNARTPNLYERVSSVSLPGELQKTQRVTDLSLPSDDVVRILSVGTIEPRKNHLALLEAFELMQSKLDDVVNVELVLVGIDPYPELAAEVEAYTERNASIRWHKKVTDHELSELYRATTFTVYPSLEEGFGLPILESLWNARPCICRDVGAMAEVAEGGGCIMVDTASPAALANAMTNLVTHPALRISLAEEAVSRQFLTWENYGNNVLEKLAAERHIPKPRSSVVPISREAFASRFVNLPARPLLSICITTYNRAEWLALGLKNIFQMLPEPCPDIEILVCDNTSPDHTPEVVIPYLGRPDFSYHRNPENVGMLGNLRVTAHHARGEFVWILGDDDLVAPGGIENVLDAIRNNRDAALVYLNYSYTREDDAKNVSDLDAFFNSATPITDTTPDKVATIAELSTLSENFFTAIYCLVFRRDHALFAYSQDTTGRPFSTMLTCIPTTSHVLRRMMHEKGVWLGTPQLVVNMNVSWLKYAPIWILERIPEAFDLAEKMGAPSEAVDKCRRFHLPGLWHWFREILKDDPEGNRAFFDPRRVMSRFSHLEGFDAEAESIVEAYDQARARDPSQFPIPTDALRPPSPHI
jgi:FkbM family methyltransferase